MIFSRLKWKRISALAVSRLAGGASHRHEAEIQDLFGQLRTAEKNIRQASVELESQFLATGGDLETLSHSGNTFVAKIEKLVGVATGETFDTSFFAGAIHLIEQAANYLLECQSETERMLEALRGYSEQIEELLAAESELNRAMLPLKFVQTLFRCESAPLGPGVQQMFGALTQEMEGLNDQVRDIFGTKFKQLLQTQNTIKQVMGQLDGQARALREITTTHRAQIELSLENLKKELNANQQRDVRLRRLSKDFASEVGQVVMGLQFEDIVSQKVHHVMEALPKIEAGLNQEGAGEISTEAFQVLHQSCRLEAGQLEAAQNELARAELTIVDAVQKVLGHVTEMDSHCLSLEEFKKLTTSFDGTVQVLVEMIEEVRTLVSTSVANASRAYETLRPIGSLASDLTANVRAMSARIHLIGLNAQIQAAQAAKDSPGSGLEVLSARTSEISGQTNRISEHAATQLDALVSGLAASVKAFERLRMDGVAQESMLNDQGGHEEQQLHAFRDTALQTLNDIGNSLDEIRAKANHALANIDFGEFYKTKLPAMHKLLVAISDKAEQWLVANGSALAGENLISHYKRNYTMETERHVFDSIVPGSSASQSQVDLPAAPEVQAPPPAECALEPAAAASDLGGNVELF